jgi:hypothetical protein
MSFSTFKGKYVFHLFPYWRSPPAGKVMMSLDEFIPPIGYSFAEYVEDYPRDKERFTYICKDRTEIGDINAFFDEKLGRLKAIWYPSWRNDLKITNNIGSSDTNIQIEDCEYATFYPATPGTGRYIFIYVNKNTWYARKITNVVSPTLLTIESSLGADVTLAKLKMCCFLYLGRFDVDEIQWNYVTPEVATTDLYFIELPHEYAEL